MAKKSFYGQAVYECNTCQKQEHQEILPKGWFFLTIGKQEGQQQYLTPSFYFHFCSLNHLNTWLIEHGALSSED